MENSEDNNRSYPPWVKLWASKYADLLDIESVMQEYEGEDLNNFLMGMGKVFLNLLYAYTHYYDEDCTIFKLSDRYQKMLYKQLMRDLDQTFSEYEKRRKTNYENGLKGGRPPGS